MAQAVFERINAQFQGDLVEEGFDGKDIAMAAQRAQRRGAYGHAEHAVVDRLPAVEVVKRDGVALGAAAGGERGVDGDQALEGLFQMRGGEHRRRVGATGAGAVAVGPDLVLPGADAAIGGDIGLEFDRHGRAKGRPTQFVLARPLHLHRLARHGARQQHRVVGGIVGGVVSVATRAFDVLHDDALGR